MADTQRIIADDGDIAEKHELVQTFLRSIVWIAFVVVLIDVEEKSIKLGVIEKVVTHNGSPYFLSRTQETTP